MDKEWIPHKDVNYSYNKIKQIHLDTRDFHCLVQITDYEEVVPIEELLKNKEEYFYTPEEIEFIFNDLFERSGGARKWRFLAFKGINCGWDLKYIRCYNTEHGFVVNSRGRDFRKKEFWKNEIDSESLH